MYLSQNQACIALYDHSRLTEKEIQTEIDKLKSHTSGQYAVLLESTGCKLKFDTQRDAFYLDGYHYSEFDNVFIYDSLNMIDDYWEYLSDTLDFSQESIERKKQCYVGYRDSIEQKLPYFMSCLASK